MSEPGSELCYALIARPSAAMATVRRTSATRIAMAIVVLALVSQHVAGALFDVPPANRFLWTLVVVGSFVVKVVMAAALWLTLTLTCHAVARLMGGYSEIGRCFSLLGLSAAPLALGTPLALLARASGAGGALFYANIALPLLALWALVLAVIGLREVYRLGPASAVISVLLPPVVLIAGGGALSFLGLLYVARVLGGLSEVFTALL